MTSFLSQNDKVMKKGAFKRRMLMKNANINLVTQYGGCLSVLSLAGADTLQHASVQPLLGLLWARSRRAGKRACGVALASISTADFPLRFIPRPAPAVPPSQAASAARCDPAGIGRDLSYLLAK